MSIENAQVVKMSDLLSAKIGDNDEDRRKSDDELSDALLGKNYDDDLLGLDNTPKEDTNSQTIETKTESSNENLSNENTSTDKTEEGITEEPTIFENSEQDKPGVSTDKLEKSKFYKETLRLMYGNTITSIVEEDSEGNEIEVSLEDAVIDEAYFNQLVKAKQEDIERQASEGKISTKGMSQFALDLVDIDRNGGDISELIQSKEAYTDPLDNLDLDNEADQEKAVYLRMMAGGQSHDTTMRLIASYKQEGILEDMARTADQELRGAVAAQVEQAKELAKQEAEKRKSLFKEYKKEIRTNLESYQLKDTIKNKIVKLATDQDDSGRFEMDKLYRQHRENPKDAADLALFLLDKEEFIKQVTNTATENTKLSTAHKLKIVKTAEGAGKGTQISQEQNRYSNDLDISLSELKNT